MDDPIKVQDELNIQNASTIPIGKFPFSGRVLIPLEQTEEEKKAGTVRLQRSMSHPPRTVIIGAPRRGGVYETMTPKNKRQAKRAFQCKPGRYIVFSDGSLRRQDKLMLKHFKSMTPEKRTEMVREAVTRAQAAPMEEANVQA